MIEDNIKKAIDYRKIIEITYNNMQIRIVEPYIIYISSTGKTLVDCYQLRGYSKSGVYTGWKAFELNKINSVSLTDESFYIRSEYNPNNRKRYVKILHKI
ncbi:MAG: hypothetical protein ACTSRP_01330 [Candidatus Helarchaeota archaeon]